MSGLRGKSRRLSDEERRLWREVTRKIARLRPQAADTPDTAEPEETGFATRVKTAPRVAKPASARPPKTKAPPAPAPLTRREKAKVARGRNAIDRRLDLHGHTQDEAHAALLRFLQRASADGARLVLVITGKSGVLKRRVPLWLGLPEFRALIVGFDVAHPRHGGDGALYLRLRKAH